MTENYVLARVEWRKSSFSGGGGDYGADCVEVASLADGSIAVRDSKCPAAGAIRFAVNVFSDVTALQRARRRAVHAPARGARAAADESFPAPPVRPHRGHQSGRAYRVGGGRSR